MDSDDQDKRAGEKSGDDQVTCPACAERPLPYINVVDTREGKTYRLYRCRCGQIVWRA